LIGGGGAPKQLSADAGGGTGGFGCGKGKSGRGGRGGGGTGGGGAGVLESGRRAFVGILGAFQRCGIRACLRGEFGGGENRFCGLGGGAGQIVDFAVGVVVFGAGRKQVGPQVPSRGSGKQRREGLVALEGGMVGLFFCGQTCGFFLSFFSYLVFESRLAASCDPVFYRAWNWQGMAEAGFGVRDHWDDRVLGHPSIWAGEKTGLWGDGRGGMGVSCTLPPAFTWKRIS